MFASKRQKFNKGGICKSVCVNQPVIIEPMVDENYEEEEKVSDVVVPVRGEYLPGERLLIQLNKKKKRSNYKRAFDLGKIEVAIKNIIHDF